MAVRGFTGCRLLAARPRQRLPPRPERRPCKRDRARYPTRRGRRWARHRDRPDWESSPYRLLWGPSSDRTTGWRSWALPPWVLAERLRGPYDGHHPATVGQLRSERGVPDDAVLASTNSTTVAANNNAPNRLPSQHRRGPGHLGHDERDAAPG